MVIMSFADIFLNHKLTLSYEICVLYKNKGTKINTFKRLIINIETFHLMPGNPHMMLTTVFFFFLLPVLHPVPWLVFGVYTKFLPLKSKPK